jgi:hypothetical protein
VLAGFSLKPHPEKRKALANAACGLPAPVGMSDAFVVLKRTPQSKHASGIPSKKVWKQRGYVLENEVVIHTKACPRGLSGHAKPSPL